MGVVPVTEIISVPADGLVTTSVLEFELPTGPSTTP
jgi:hypothetical protein